MRSATCLLSCAPSIAVGSSRPFRKAALGTGHRSPPGEGNGNSMVLQPSKARLGVGRVVVSKNSLHDRPRGPWKVNPSMSPLGVAFARSMHSQTTLKIRINCTSKSTIGRRPVTSRNVLRTPSTGVEPSAASRPGRDEKARKSRSIAFLLRGPTLFPSGRTTKA